MTEGAAEKSRVLVVDDEPQITRVLRTVLSSQGYQVRTAAEGEAALAAFAEFRPELVITDLYMPHMDGIELCRRIRGVSAVPIMCCRQGEEAEGSKRRRGAASTSQAWHRRVLARVRAALRDARPSRRCLSTPGSSGAIWTSPPYHRGMEVRLAPERVELFATWRAIPPRADAPLADRGV